MTVVEASVTTTTVKFGEIQIGVVGPGYIKVSDEAILRIKTSYLYPADPSMTGQPPYSFLPVEFVT